MGPPFLQRLSEGPPLRGIALNRLAHQLPESRLSSRVADRNLFASTSSAPVSAHALHIRTNSNTDRAANSNPSIGFPNPVAGSRTCIHSTPWVRVSKINSARQLRLDTSVFWVLTMGWTWVFFCHLRLGSRRLQSLGTQRRSAHETPGCAGQRSRGNIAVKTRSQRSAILNSPSACRGR
jgi:hypothetical protein